jgi:hypothetical protein
MTPEQKAKWNGANLATGHAGAYNERAMRFAEPPSRGLSKREAFAMAAMQGLVNRSSLYPKDLGTLAVQYADALLLALERQDGQPNEQE